LKEELMKKDKKQPLDIRHYWMRVNLNIEKILKHLRMKLN